MEIVQCSRVEGIHYKLVPGQTRYAVGYTDYEDFMSMPDWLDQGGYQGSEIRFLDLTDNTIWVPFTKRENVLYGNTLLWEDKLWFLRGDFNIGQMTLIAFRPGEKPEEIHSIPVSEVNLYNLQILPHPVHIVSQSDELRCYYPQSFRIPLEPNETAAIIDGDSVWCSAWMEEGVEDGQLTKSYRYYETTVEKDRTGKVLSRQTGDLNLFHDGVWRLS